VDISLYFLRQENKCHPELNWQQDESLQRWLEPTVVEFRVVPWDVAVDVDCTGWDDLNGANFVEEYVGSSVIYRSPLSTMDLDKLHGANCTATCPLLPRSWCTQKKVPQSLVYR
jgi:hypothetical protein